MTLGSTYFKMWIFQGVRVYKNQLNQTNRDFGDEKTASENSRLLSVQIGWMILPGTADPKKPWKMKMEPSKQKIHLQNFCC